MLDKNKIDSHIDKAFAKASWKNMSDMLDQELPVPKKEKNKLVILLSSLLFLSFVTIGFLVNANLNQPKFADVTKEKISYKNIYVPVAQLTADKETPSYTNSNSSKKVSQTSANTTSQLISHTSDTQNQVVQALNLDTADKIKIEKSTPLSRIHKTESITSAGFLSISKIQNLFSQLEFKTNAPDNSGLLDYSIFRNENRKNKRKIRYNLSLITTVANNFDFSGYGFSAGIDIPLGKNLDVSLGLAHNELSRDFFVFPFFSPEDDLTTLPLNKPLLKNQASEQDFYAGLRNMKQLLIPIRVNYNINEYFSFVSGLNFRYTYNRIIDNPVNALNNRAIRSKKKGDLEKRSTERSYFVDNTIGLSAGVKFKVSKNISFALDSEWGINSIIDEQAFNVSNGKAYKLNILSLSTNLSF